MVFIRSVVRKENIINGVSNPKKIDDCNRFYKFLHSNAIMGKESQGRKNLSKQRKFSTTTTYRVKRVSGLLPSSVALREYQYGTPEISAIQSGKVRRFHCAFSCNVQHLHKNFGTLSAHTLTPRHSIYCSVLSPLPLRRICTWALFHSHSFKNLVLKGTTKT